MRGRGALLGFVLAALPYGRALAAEADPWEAPARLETFPAVHRSGWILGFGAARRAAVAGDLVLRVEGGGERAAGPGFRLAAVLDRAAGAREIEGTLVGRTARVRAALGVGVLRWRDRGAGSAIAMFHLVVFPGVLAGAEARFYPRASAEPVETVVALYAARGNAWAGVRLHSGFHRLRLAVGARVTPRFTWFVAYRDGDPSVGIALGAGAFEIRAAETAHTRLGGVSEASVRVGRAP